MLCLTNPSDFVPLCRNLGYMTICHDISLEICTPRYEATFTFSRGSFFRVYTVTIGSSFHVILIVLHFNDLEEFKLIPHIPHIPTLQRF